MTDLIAEKLGQVVEILQEQALDCWMIFVRETTDAGDPVLPLVLGHNLTWQSALLLHRDGRRVAIVGKFEDETVAAGGLWTDVIPYVQSIREPLLDTLRKLAPKTIAVNYSRDDVKADGLSHGMFLVLQDHLAGTPYADALVPADGIIAALRGRKAPAEVDRIRAAIAATDEVFDELRAFARPGRSEVEIAQFMRAQALARQCEPAWDTRQCPLVTSGPGSMIGHGLPSETLQIEPGRVFHVDFGVRKDGYCSDLQRVWYVPENGQTTPPEGVQQAFETVRKAIEAAAARLAPGVEGWRVDQAARNVVLAAGYPEYEHATGHQVGRSAHDGGGILGPCWDRYGQTPFRRAEEGNVFTLELGLAVEDRGYVGLEEMVLVTAQGCRYLSDPQTTLWDLA